MADGRQRTAWSHTAALMLGFQKSMTGQGPRLIDLIPERYHGEDAEQLTEEMEEVSAEIAFAELEAGLKALSRSRERKIAGFKG